MSAVHPVARLTDGIQCAVVGAVSVLLRRQIRLEDRFEDQQCRRLHNAITDCRYTQRSCAAGLARLRDQHPTHRLWAVPLVPEFFRQFTQPSFHTVRLDLPEGLAINARHASIGLGDTVGEG